VHGPGGWTNGPHLNRDTAVLPQPDTGGKLPTATYCSCVASPWCSGPSGPGWIDCLTSCKACHPPQRRRRGAPDGPGSRFYQGSEDPGSSLNALPD
jgi:hypothetical protein